MPKKQIGVEHKVALKRKRTRQIVAFAMIGIVLVLAALIITGACVNVNLAPSTINSPSNITIYDKTTQHGTFCREDSEYDAFMEKYNDMFKTSYLNALFSGSLGGYTISSQDAKNVQTLSSVQTKLREGYYVHFNYLEPQKLKYSNGDACLDANNLVHDELTYTNVYFALTDNNDFADFKIYVVVNFYSSTSSTSDKVLEIRLKANTSTLYSSLSDFKTN